MKSYCVYKHISPSNKVYIGITCQKPNERWLNGKGYKKNKYFFRAINKYGWGNFSHIIVAKGLSEDEAKWLEIQLIAVYDSTNKDNGYNLSKGGEGASGCHRTEEYKKKVGDFFRGKSLSEEHKKKIRENNWMLGRHGKYCPASTKVLCLTTGKSFYSIEEAGDYYNIKSRTNISACCRGERKTCDKKRWTYLNGDMLINFSHNKTYRKAVDKS